MIAEILKGKNIAIGRDPQMSNLRVTIEGTGKAIGLGQPQSVPMMVSRNIESEKKSHARLVIDSMGRVMLFNTNPANHTYADGKEVVGQMMVKEETQIALGVQQGYRVKVSSILNAAAQKLKPQRPVLPPVTGPEVKVEKKKGEGAKPPKPPEKEFNILHLKHAYDQYHGWEMEVQKKNQKVTLLRSAMPLFTLGAGTIGSFMRSSPDLADYAVIPFIFTGIGLILCVMSFLMMKKSAGPEEKERMKDEFQEQWRCPNPDCRKILPNVSYKVLRVNYPSCPYCKSKFRE